MAPSITARVHTAFPELRADQTGRTINLTTTAAPDPKPSFAALDLNGSGGWVAGVPDLPRH